MRRSASSERPPPPPSDTPSAMETLPAGNRTCLCPQITRHAAVPETPPTGINPLQSAGPATPTNGRTRPLPWKPHPLPSGPRTERSWDWDCLSLCVCTVPGTMRLQSQLGQGLSLAVCLASASYPDGGPFFDSPMAGYVGLALHWDPGDLGFQSHLCYRLCATLRYVLTSLRASVSPQSLNFPCAQCGS